MHAPAAHRSTRRWISSIALLIGVSIATPSQAGGIFRNAALISTMPIAGVTLSMTLAEAEAYLKSTGFEETDRLTAQMGNGVVTYKKGITQISLGHRGSVLESIGENSHRRDGTRFDFAKELAAPRAHFSIGSGERDCRFHKRGAVCGVTDQREASYVYGLQVLPTLRTAQLVRYPRK